MIDLGVVSAFGGKAGVELRPDERETWEGVLHPPRKYLGPATRDRPNGRDLGPVEYKLRNGPANLLQPLDQMDCL